MNTQDRQASWRPTATREMLLLRAELLTRARRFFADRGVLEVDTPIVVNAAVTDVHIHSARVWLGGNESAGAASGQPFYLHTSPEYAMKRLLAAGSGDIFQICHVVRGFERSRQHNPEFTLIEWYRLGFSLDDLMTEVQELVRQLLGHAGAALTAERLSYRDAFVRVLQLDPFTASLSELAAAARTIGFSQTFGAQDARARDSAAERDELLELLMGARVGPRLGQPALTCVHGFPASQAALARLDPADARAALRFELYCQGIELANGFEELSSASEQRMRFERDNAARQRMGLPVSTLDERLLAALESGLPACSGVALGFDRTLMLAAAADHIDTVLVFPTDRA